MKRIGNLWNDLTRWGNLLMAYRKARRGKPLAGRGVYPVRNVL